MCVGDADALYTLLAAVDTAHGLPAPGDAMSASRLVALLEERYFGPKGDGEGEEGEEGEGEGEDMDDEDDFCET